MNERIEKSLYDILAAIGEIDSFFYYGPKRFAYFASNRLLQRGVERNLEIIGEATNRILKVEPDFSITNARSIVGLRNYVIHGYDSLSVDMVWNVVINHLPPLKAEIESLLAE
jgi:uncharacterized protein with HEPN domain